MPALNALGDDGEVRFPYLQHAFVGNAERNLIEPLQTCAIVLWIAPQKVRENQDPSSINATPTRINSTEEKVATKTDQTET